MVGLNPLKGFFGFLYMLFLVVFWFAIRGDIHTHLATTNVNLMFTGVGVFLLDVCFLAKMLLLFLSSSSLELSDLLSSIFCQKISV